MFINMLNNLYVGSFINDNLILGVTTNTAFTDYIKEGYNPVQDSIVISQFQLFLKCYIDNFFFLIKLPTPVRRSNIIDANIRVGVGCIIYRNKEIDLELSYNRLLQSNYNRFSKGELNLGISTSFSRLKVNRKSINEYSNLSNFFDSILDWIHTPLVYGYKESL